MIISPWQKSWNHHFHRLNPPAAPPSPDTFAVPRSRSQRHPRDLAGCAAPWPKPRGARQGPASDGGFQRNPCNLVMGLEWNTTNQVAKKTWGRGEKNCSSNSGIISHFSPHQSSSCSMILLVRTPMNSINHNSSKPKWLSRHLVLHVLHLLCPTQLQKRNCFSQLSQRPPTPDFSSGQLVWKSLENVSWRDWK